MEVGGFHNYDDGLDEIHSGGGYVFLLHNEQEGLHSVVLCSRCSAAGEEQEEDNGAAGM